MKCNAKAVSSPMRFPWLTSAATLLGYLSSCGLPSDAEQKDAHPSTDTANEAIIFGVEVVD